MVNSLGNYLLNNILNNVVDDFVILISKEEKKIKVHKCIARKSDFINLLINENTDDSIIEIHLDFNKSIIEMVRDYIYDIKIIFNNKNYQELFYLSDYLSIPDLSEDILNWILKFGISNINAISTYKFIKNSSYRESEYYEKIICFINKNINNILFQNEIKMLEIDEYLSFLDTDMHAKIIFSSFKFWSEDKENQKLLFEKILEVNILIPGLLNINDLFTEYFPFLEKLGIKICDYKKLSILELSNFKKEILVYCKRDYDKYLWAMSLKIDDEIDFKDNCSYKWLTGVICNLKLISKNCKYKDSLIIQIKSLNKNLEFILPDDISKIDKLHTNTIEWRKQLKKNMIINFCNKNKILPAKIIAKQGDEILIYTTDDFYYKTTIYCKDIFTSNMIYFDYFEETNFDESKFKDIELDTIISNL